MRRSKPLLGYLDKAELKPSLYRTFLSLSLFWVIFCLVQGLRLWHRHDLLDMVVGGLMLLICLCQSLLGFMFWRLWLAAKSADWLGDRWFQLMPSEDDLSPEAVMVRSHTALHRKVKAFMQGSLTGRVPAAPADNQDDRSGDSKGR